MRLSKRSPQQEPHQFQSKKKNEQKNDSKKEKQEGATAAEATGASASSRNVVRKID